MPPAIHDLAIVGVGGMGSAAFWAAAERGLNVLALEQFGPAHDRGSSHGQTRIIRAAYFEHPSYVPMAQRSFQLWDEISARSRRPLLRRCGLLQAGPPDSAVIAGVRASAQQYALDVEELSPEEIEARWPVFKIEPGQVGLFESGAGYLRVEWCCAAMIRLAIDRGGEYHGDAAVQDWRVEADGTVRLETAAAEFRARQVIFAGGPWSASLLAGLKLPLQVVRKQQHWVQVDRADIHDRAGFCCFLFDTPGGCFYGFPAIDHLGMKFAEHSGGSPVADPSQLDRELDASDWKRTSEFIERTFRFGRTRLTHHSACMYTRTPDEHFLIDLHPEHPQIAFVAGLSGHGFKFAPVIGQQLVDLLQGASHPNCEFLRLKRIRESTDL
ncbi:MAG: N-methyl-L-tryptophan oxidase [Blastopirellula sp.]|nr:N-methyl-L-tryptophan oxidase [Blastopirellula sp.]